MFPLIQLPKKSEEKQLSVKEVDLKLVSINSTSEEVRRNIYVHVVNGCFRVSINSTSEEVRSPV